MPIRRSSSSTQQQDFYQSTSSKPGSELDLRKLYSASLSRIADHKQATEYHIKPQPFYIRWVHGYNQRVGVLNLNKNGSTTLFYAASNFGVLYNWTTNTMRVLQGHRHMVTCIATDEQGDWLATGDMGPENVVIIWDSTDAFPHRTIFNPHRHLKLAKLALSHDAKYLLTVAYGEQTEIFWWIWSVQQGEPHAWTRVPIKKDTVVNICFNPTNSLQFSLLTKDSLWIGEAAKIFVNERGVIRETDSYELKMYNPEKKPNLDLGRHQSSCFVATTAQILVCTSRGGIMTYGFSMEYRTEADSAKIKNMKFIKALKVENHRINVIRYVDGVVVTGNCGGEIHFYDDQLRLLYWVHGFTVDSVKGLSFNLAPRSYMILDPKCNKPCLCWESVVAEKDPKTGELRTKLIKKKLPTDATKKGLPFLVRDFILCTFHQGIHFVDFVTEKTTKILDYRVSNALSLSVHPEKKLVCISYNDGHIELINFEQHKLQVRLDLRDYYKVVIPPKDDSIKDTTEVTIPQLSVTCLKYSPSGLHLACGLNTGQLVFLDPTTIDVITKKPFKDTQFAIQEIDYSPDSLTLAFSDAGKTVCVYKYDCEEFKWNFIGKHRAHYKDITSLFFLPAKNPDGEYKLLSLGMDRIMVEYDIGASNDEYLELVSLDRLEQSAMPLCGVVWPVPKGMDPNTCYQEMPVILIANDEFKYKIINYETTMTLATLLGPRFDHPVKQVILFSQKHEEAPEEHKTSKEEQNPEATAQEPPQEVQYMVFATKIIIGIQKLPLDGNPWKHIGMLGHPNQLLATCFREDVKSLFTIGSKDNCMCQWLANPRATDKSTKLGGDNLDPYYCLIENGRPGWLFQEIRDLFYYIQILCQGTFTPAMRRVKDYIPVDSLPDLMRALGFFPSEYEVENLLVEAKFKIYNKTPVAEIDFEEFVKLYLNHRPAFAQSFRKIKQAFRTFAVFSERDGEHMKREYFVKMLTGYGEHFSEELAWYLLSILAGHSFEDRAARTPEDFSFLPMKLTISDIKTIMGIPDLDTRSEQGSLAGTEGSGGSSCSSEDSDDRWL